MTNADNASLFEFEAQPDGPKPNGGRRNGTTNPAANDLDGKTWNRNSISVWHDIKKDREEISLRHPAIYPKALVRRCLESFTRSDQRVVLDPFAGSGSTLLAAAAMGKDGIGFEINPEYVHLAEKRQHQLNLFEGDHRGNIRIYGVPASRLGEYLAPESVDICITSPPYWNILNQRRTADNKDVRNYGNLPNDLGTIEDYEEFNRALGLIFAEVYKVLKPGSYCLVNVMDLRKGPIFYPFHCDLAKTLSKWGYIWDDLIIWDRRSEYNNMRPLGYPTVFRINKAHEYILIFQKPR